MMSKLYVLTGGPGAGKTSLLNELEKKGFVTVPEDGRRIIREQIAINGDALPWMDKEKFAGLMLEASVNAYQKMSEIPGEKTVFFDRGILDVIGYLRLEKIPVPEDLEMKAGEMVYHNHVFILPPWEEIYVNDPERKQTSDIAISTFNCMKTVYLEYGYTVIEVPKISVTQRVEFILDMIR